MNLITNFKKPVWLFLIGMIIVLLAAFLKITRMLPLLHVPMFLFGFALNLIAIVIFIKKNSMNNKTI
jgi:uncharacterized membrane protein